MNYVFAFYGARKMPVRFIQIQGSTSTRKRWLAPLILMLAAVGGALIFLMVAVFGVIALAVGGLVRLFLPAAAPNRASRGGFIQHLVRRLFGSGGPQSHSSTNPNHAGDTSTPPTIPMDRGKDGIWRP